MEIIGTGLSGLVGSKFVEMCASKYACTNLDLTVHVDITKEEQVFKAVEGSSSPVIIHMAAFTDVTKAWEQRGDKDGICYAVNVRGTENIARAAKRYGKHLIHLSTAFVFDGNTESMYTEDDQVNPIEWYGVTKAEAEKVVQDICSKWTIFRIDQPFRSDPFPKQDTVHKMAEQIQKGGFTPFADHYFSPTVIEDFARVLDWAVVTPPQGIYHATVNRKVSDFEYANMINAALKLGASITPGHLDDYLKTLNRPYQRNTAMSSDKLLRAAKGIAFTQLEEALSRVKLP